MIKRINPIVPILVLVITLIMVSFKYKTLLDEHSRQQTNINAVFKRDLSTARNLFAESFLTNEYSVNYNYNQAQSQIASAFQLFQFTTYADSNNGLMEPLDNLSNIMMRDEYKEIVMKKSNLIYQDLSQLTINPDDKQATEKLVKLIEEIIPKRS